MTIFVQVATSACWLLVQLVLFHSSVDYSPADACNSQNFGTISSNWKSNGLIKLIIMRVGLKETEHANDYVNKVFKNSLTHV